jgi:hypothetical protein
MASRLTFLEMLFCLLMGVLFCMQSDFAYAQGSAKDLEGSEDAPLRMTARQSLTESECAKVKEQEKAEKDSRKMIADRCQAVNEKLSSLGQPHCERNLCFSSWRSPGARKVEVTTSIWNTSAYSRSPGLSLTIAIYFDSQNEGIFDCTDISAPSFSLDQLSDYQLYQEILEQRQLCK